jgi:predicted dithiol-disulfide oxidoreductase (DUF899 family)
MFGPQRERLGTMCTSLLDAWDGEARYVEQRIALAIIAARRSSASSDSRERGWRNLKLYSDAKAEDGQRRLDYQSLARERKPDLLV